MKRLLAIVLIHFSIFPLSGNCQVSVDELLAKVWVFKMATPIQECSLAGIPTGVTQTPLPNYQFRVVNILANGDLVVKFLHWKVATTRVAGVLGFAASAPTSPNAVLNENFFMDNYLVNNFTAGRVAHFRYFLINRQQFDARCEERLPTRQFTVGATTLPIKMRFGGGADGSLDKRYSAFTGNISLGLSFGLKRNYNRQFAVNYLTGLALSSVPVSSETTKAYIESETNQAAITWHIGILSEINNFQIGIYTGIDYLSGKVQKQWVYRNKPWLGVAIGFSLFNAKKTTETQ